MIYRGARDYGISMGLWSGEFRAFTRLARLMASPDRSRFTLTHRAALSRGGLGRYYGRSDRSSISSQPHP